jgi:hypothetical protein
MSDQEQEATSSAEEETETMEAQETETTEEQESSAANETDKYRKIAEDQRKRAEKAEAELKKAKDKPAPSNAGALSPEAEARLTRSELFGLGIKDADEQKFVTDAAKRLGVSVYEAANDELIAARLEKMREARKTKEATPAPSRGNGASTSNVTKLAEKALATGELPTDPALREKVRTEMKRISK